MGEFLKRAVAQAQINQLENRKEELRLEHIPDLEAIRSLDEAIKKIREQFPRSVDQADLSLLL